MSFSDGGQWLPDAPALGKGFLRIYDTFSVRMDDYYRNCLGARTLVG